MDRELKDHLDRMERRLTDEIRQLRASVDKRGRELHKYGDESQQLRISAERRGEEIRRMAEGVMRFNEKLDSFRKEVSQEFTQLRNLLSSL